MDELDARHFAITPGIAETLREACRVHLTRSFDNRLDETFEFEDQTKSATTACDVSWSSPSEKELEAWNDHNVTVEHVAIAFAAAILDRLCGLHIVHRMETGKGFDYFVNEANENHHDSFFESCTRLEVSGTNVVGKPHLISLLQRKLKQGSQSGEEPCFAFVVSIPEKSVKFVKEEA